jgi:putative transposase
MRSIVGKAAEEIRDHMPTELPLAALLIAAQRPRPAPGLICHSDLGSQYAAGAYVDHLAAIGAVPVVAAAKGTRPI